MTALQSEDRTLKVALTNLADSVDWVAQTADTDGMDPLGVLYLLADLRDLRMKLQQVEAVVEAAAAQAMPSDRVEAPDLIAERRSGKDRKEWKHDDLRRAVVEKAILDTATGEMAVEPDVAFGLVDEVFACAAVSYWRVTALKARGISPDDFCTSSPGRRTVQVSRSVTE